MDRSILNEVVNLKEKRRMLMAECNGNINENTFSKTEKQFIKKHRHDEQACLTLEVIDAAIREDEELLLEE